MPQIRDYTQATSILPTDAFIIDRIGVGSLYIDADTFTASTGTVTSITAGAGLTGGTIITSGTIALSVPVSTANGGTGQTTYSNGQLLIGNAGSLTAATLTAGSNISITNGPGTITIAATGSAAGVTAFNTRTGAVTLTSGDVTTALTYTPVNPASAALTGTPTAPTASALTSNTFVTVDVSAILSASLAGGAANKLHSNGSSVTSPGTFSTNCWQMGNAA